MKLKHSNTMAAPRPRCYNCHLELDSPLCWHNLPQGRFSWYSFQLFFSSFYTMQRNMAYFLHTVGTWRQTVNHTHTHTHTNKYVQTAYSLKGIHDNSWSESADHAPHTRPSEVSILQLSLRLTDCLCFHPSGPIKNGKKKLEANIESSSALCLL